MKDIFKPGIEVKNLRSGVNAKVNSVDKNTNTCNLKVEGIDRIVDYDLDTINLLWIPMSFTTE